MFYDILSEYTHPNSSPIDAFFLDKVPVIDDWENINDGPITFSVHGFSEDLGDLSGEFKKLHIPAFIDTLLDSNNQVLQSDKILEEHSNKLFNSIKPKIRPHLKVWVKLHPKIGNLTCCCGSNKLVKKCCGKS